MDNPVDPKYTSYVVGDLYFLQILDQNVEALSHYLNTCFILLHDIIFFLKVNLVAVINYYTFVLS